MIGQLKGIIDQITGNQIILDVNGVGYVVQAGARTLAATNDATRQPGLSSSANFTIKGVKADAGQIANCNRVLDVGMGLEVAERVLASGEKESLDPMTPFERKIVHDAVAGVDGVVSESEGAEPKRRVVVLRSA